MANDQHKQGVLFEEYSDGISVQQVVELANPWALDKSGNPILPENAERHGSYTCPKCHEPLTIRKRGKGEHSRRDHFCHRPDTDCKGFTPHETESYIHKTAKRRIYQILQSCLGKQEPFSISWTCPECGNQFNGNLLYHAKSVAMERQFEDKAAGQDHKQPDVSLVDENEKLLVAIEVVYTHDIEPETWDFFDRHNVAVLRLKFNSVEDLNNIGQKLHFPDSVSVCLNFACKACQTMHQPRKLSRHYDKVGHQFFVANILSPFSDQVIQGVPLTDEEFNLAEKYVKKKSQLLGIERRQDSQGRHFALIVQRQVIQRQTYRRRYQTIDDLDRRSYSHHNMSKGRKYSSSSSSSKRRSGYKKNGGKRR